MLDELIRVAIASMLAADWVVTISGAVSLIALYNLGEDN